MDEREKIIEALKRSANEWHKEEFDPMARAHFSYIEYNKLADALIEAGIGDVKGTEHRAEVAERALELMARRECTFAPPEFYKEEAEREVAEEEQIMANRCGEGKCEYFESIRRAANNNREYGYCKKYKQDLHLYDWWWLKCDECTAEKEIAEEKGE